MNDNNKSKYFKTKKHRTVQGKANIDSEPRQGPEIQTPKLQMIGYFVEYALVTSVLLYFQHFNIQSITQPNPQKYSIKCGQYISPAQATNAHEEREG